MKIELSIICPTYNEEEGIENFLAKLKSVLQTLNTTYEVIVIDDGSSDRTVEILRSIVWSELRILALPINSGHMSALSVGYSTAKGDWVLTMDSDLQHPPEEIPNFLEIAKQQKVDVVYGVRKNRKEDSAIKKATAKFYYKLMRSLTSIPIEDSAADFRLVSKRVVEILKSISGATPVYRLLIPSLGFNSQYLYFSANNREFGTSKYTSLKMIKLFVESVVGFTTKPLYLSIFLGLFISFLAVCGFLYVLLVYLFGSPSPGWASLVSLLLLLFGGLFVIVGIQGAYIGEILRSVRYKAIVASEINNESK